RLRNVRNGGGEVHVGDFGLGAARSGTEWPDVGSGRIAAELREIGRDAVVLRVVAQPKHVRAFVAEKRGPSGRGEVADGPWRQDGCTSPSQNKGVADAPREGDFRSHDQPRQRNEACGGKGFGT